MPTAFCSPGFGSGPLYSQVVPLHISARSYMPDVPIFVIVITALLAFGILICVLSHHKMGARSWRDQRNRHQSTNRYLQQPYPQPHKPYSQAIIPTASMMYSSSSLQERQRMEAGAHQDHLIRIHSVQTDLALNLPHSIALPDGEEGPRCDLKLLKLHDPEQHAEITRSFIRPPPNRTVPECSCITKFRSNSVGLLQKPSTPPLQTQVEPTVLVPRSHSVSSSNGHASKLGLSRGSCTPNPDSPYIWLPSPGAVSSCASADAGNSNRTYSSKPTSDRNFECSEEPPPYSDVVNQMDIKVFSWQQNSGV